MWYSSLKIEFIINKFLHHRLLKLILFLHFRPLEHAYYLTRLTVIKYYNFITLLSSF